jgi:hypothetical protein
MLLQPRGISPNPSVNVGEKFGENSVGKEGSKLQMGKEGSKLQISRIGR